MPAPPLIAPVRMETPAIPPSSVQSAQAPSAPVRTTAHYLPAATPTREPEPLEDDGHKTMLLAGPLFAFPPANPPPQASAAPIRTSPPAKTSPAFSSAVAVTPGTAISVRNPRPVPAVSSANVHPARPGVVTATYQVIPAQLETTQFVLSKTVDSHLPMLLDRSTERAAAFRALRRRLAEQKDPRVILVTSAQEDEGKTTCAANLALAMAESGRLRVLLVEANLRRPKLSTIFGFQPSCCLRNQLATHREHIDARWQTTELQPTGLHVLAVAANTSGSDVLHGPTFSASTLRWRCAFDYVVIDGPSILESCDASIIHDCVDAVIMAVRSGVSQNRTVRRALDQISAEMVAGMVLMDSPAG